MQEESIEYTDGPLGNLEVIPDFLPPPAKLVLKQDREEATSSLNHKIDNDSASQSLNDNTTNN